MHRGSSVVGALLLLAVVLVARPSGAACLNPCELSVSEPTVTPQLASCVEVTTTAEDCNCGAGLRVLNRCQQAITADDFTFDSCWSGGGPVTSCTSLEPAFQGSVTFRLSEVGTTEKTLSLRDDAGTHQVRFESNVVSFVDGGCAGCASTSQRVRPAYVMGLLLVLVVARRRRRRAP